MIPVDTGTDGSKNEIPLYRKSNFSINTENRRGDFNESIYLTNTCDQATLLFVVDVPFKVDIDKAFVSVEGNSNINKIDFTIGQATAIMKYPAFVGMFNKNKVCGIDWKEGEPKMSLVNVQVFLSLVKALKN